MTQRDKVIRLEEALKDVAQVDCPVRHYFAPGLYAREITIPAGTAITGAVHRLASLVVLSAGALRLVTDDGYEDIQAPHTRTCKAGAKNAAVALETAVWTNFFPNPEDESDVEKLVEILTESKATDLIGGTTNKQLMANRLAELERA